MHKSKLGITVVVLWMSLVFCASHGFAADSPSSNTSVPLKVEPFRYAAVNGYRQLFEAHHWMDSHYSGGINSAEWETKLPYDLQLRTDGHAIFGQNDYSAFARMDKEDKGYIQFDYQEFKKYYGNRGGYFSEFTSLSSPSLGRELSLDIKSLKTEVGLQFENLPDVKFIYEFEQKKGDKSRLTWASVTEGGMVRKIAPSFQEIDEKVHVFEIELEDVYRDWEWSASQKWESVSSDTLREEQQLSMTPVAADAKIRNHILKLDADSVETVIGVERWFLKDRLFVGNHYRYSQLENGEIERIAEMNERRSLESFTAPHQILDSPSTNQYYSHTWVGSILYNITKQLNTTAKTKAEFITKNGQSTLILDSTAAQIPDGSPNRFDVSNTDAKIGRMGENVSLRFMGIPKTALYLEGEAEQNRHWLSENRQSSSAAETVDREVLAHLYRWVGTIGAQAQPLDWLKGTWHYRRRYDNSRYNNLRYPSFTATAAKSVFIEGQNIKTDEIATRVTLKHWSKFEPTVRYQFRNRSYETWGWPDDQNESEAEDMSHTYTLDLVFYPKESLMATLSFSYQDAMTSTAARDVARFSIPAFDSDVVSTLLGFSYAPSDKLSWNSTLGYSAASNYSDIATFQLPLGVSFNRLDFTVGCDWKLKKDITLEPKYSFYGYWPTEDQSNQYNANVFWLNLKIQWG